MVSGKKIKLMVFSLLLMLCSCGMTKEPTVLDSGYTYGIDYLNSADLVVYKYDNSTHKSVEYKRYKYGNYSFVVSSMDRLLDYGNVLVIEFRK